MPVAIGYFLFAGPLGSIFSFGSLVAASQLAIGLGVTLVANLAFRPKIPDAPKPEDGKYNLRQNVPSLTVVLGRVKKASDYALLEEKGGKAYHIMVIAGHRINGFLAHYLHDEEVTLNTAGTVIEPAHFYPDSRDKVEIDTRLGLNAETAYEQVVDALPTIWTNDHRGDGLATVMMSAESTSAEDFQKVYPQQMPAHSGEIEGALLFDPRDGSHDPDDPDTWAFSTNLALERLFHLTHPSGGKMTLDDMHLPDWANAANVCDQSVTNKQAGVESRYHGGFWYRYENDPVEVGRILDQAAEMVIYETSDGKVGVHAGEFVTPDVRLTEDDIKSVSFDANRRQNSNVLAVRGRFTDPGKVYNTVDAAIYGNPYVGDSTERSKTVENVAVQSHNHMQRLQKIAYIRANAPRVRVLCDYEPAKQVPYRRFVKVHYPPKLDEAIVEITGRPKLSLRNLTYEFEGIVVPATLYDFTAATDEGEPPADVIELEKDDVPAPVNFDITIEREPITGGDDAAYALATWDEQSDNLIVEVEWQPTAGGPVQNLRTTTGEDDLRTGYLSDGTEYRFRARNWSAGVSSDWTDYVIETAVADTVAPLALSSFGVTGGNGNASLTFTTTGGDSHLKRIAVYRVPAGGVLDKDTHFAFRVAAAPGTSFGYIDGDATITNLLTNGTFTTDTDWTKNAGWTIAGGFAVATTAANGSAVFQAEAFAAGTNYRVKFEVSSYSAGGARAVFVGGTNVPFTTRSANGTFLETKAAMSGNANFYLQAIGTTTLQLDNAVLFAETLACAPQGVWDYYAFPENGSGVEGPQATVVEDIVIV